MNINNMIKSVRCARRLSVKELSQKADISTKFLYDIEAGKRGSVLHYAIQDCQSPECNL